MTPDSPDRIVLCLRPSGGAARPAAPVDVRVIATQRGGISGCGAVRIATRPSLAVLGFALLLAAIAFFIGQVAKCSSMPRRAERGPFADPGCDLVIAVVGLSRLESGWSCVLFHREYQVRRRSPHRALPRREPRSDPFEHARDRPAVLAEFLAAVSLRGRSVANLPSGVRMSQQRVSLEGACCRLVVRDGLIGKRAIGRARWDWPSDE